MLLVKPLMEDKYVMLKTLQTSTKITVSAMEHVKVNVSNVMMEAV